MKEMINIINAIFASCDFGLSACMLYHSLENTSGNSSIGFAVCLFCFGMGILQTAIYLKDDVK